MYRTCVGCDRDLGKNRLIRNLPVGRRIAYDTTRGRIWVVCRGCNQWNLTPLDERLEALEQCETAFHQASARASTGDIAVAHAADRTELIRIGGHATRSDIANWRYGKRLQRRRRRFVTAKLAGIGVAVATPVAIGLAAHSVGVGLWSSVFVAAYVYNLPGTLSWRRLVRYREASGNVVSLRAADVPSITFVPGGARKPLLMTCTLRDGEHRLTRDDATHVLAALLPKVNWRSGSAADIAGAITMIDRAEASGDDARDARAIWERVLTIGQHRAHLKNLSVRARLALEMAVNEHIELTELRASAGDFNPVLQHEERVAAIADSLLVPRFVTEWLAARARSRAP